MAALGSSLREKLFSYQRIVESPNDDETLELADVLGSRKQKSGRSQIWLLISIALNAFLAIAVIVLYGKYQSLLTASAVSPTGSYETGFATDFEPVKAALRTVPGPNHGALSYNETTKLIDHHHTPGAPRYFGVPSPEIDAAWHDLVQGEFFSLTEEEARPYIEHDLATGGKLIRMPQSGEYHMELGVFHSLHCVNALRKALEPDYYHHEHELFGVPKNWMREHMDHCLENIMQTVQCHGDITPVPLYAWDGFNIALGVTDTRTCRDFGKIRDWMVQRNTNGKAIDGL